MSSFRSLFPLVALIALASCASNVEEEPDSAEQNWDSAEGNPTHATHSFMAEYAIKQLAAELPEVKTFEKAIVSGANLELHDLVSKTHEALRLEIEGNNWAAEHPEILWTKAREAYAKNDKNGAYFYVGILLHYVQDMGVPAHAFHVIHQSSAKDWDHIELLGFFDFHADFKTIGAPDPQLANPVEYVEWSAATAREHFQTVFPNEKYHRKYFPQAYDQMTEVHWSFIRRREADCARGTAYALRSAAISLSQ